MDRKKRPFKSDVQQRAVRQLLISITVIIFLLVIGTEGYRWIEDMDFINALYMAVITLSTVGFGEIKTLSPEGRLFTIGLIVGGGGLAAYTLSTIISYLFSGEWRAHWEYQKQKRMFETLSDHYIICGYGRVGKHVASELEAEGHSFVIIDPDEERDNDISEHGYLCLKGDASDESVLYAAGIESARGVIVAANSDAVNVFIVLTARSIRPDILIVSRANYEESEVKLLRAGANRVMLPYRLAGRRMVTMLVRPDIDDFLDEVSDVSGLELLLEKVVIPADSLLVGKTLSEVQLHERTGVTILACKSPTGALNKIPSSSYKISANTQLIALGTREQLLSLMKLTQTKPEKKS
ncbi:TrkA-N domain protein [Chloroherpeton thalassium ATCC 35110]|uniref:TrkA-N domain protein n=1 Tax=Chloroherpeton thalassium (strain ATCC 35110 / GB-78) TaxID=517418 RepID=B3QS70_CHLT3|nr:potassium channel protein [Chloroherpeton thalassium]ACF14015.1 TrkA-N domain protein [Chloroherpeton thalassium ATCC 35110]